ncbi:hypothetical protein ACR71G_10455 [Xenorhabdus bovienii]|uniref:hypothetical protein n=1 Tax=Xenorhabdus bovienii TaxID=40576 RepID=UPI003DA34527
MASYFYYFECLNNKGEFISNGNAGFVSEGMSATTKEVEDEIARIQAHLGEIVPQCRIRIININKL